MDGASRVVLRAPSVLQTAKPKAYTAPSLDFLQGTWHVTHSTLPMWKSKRNVSITYTALEPSVPSITPEKTDRLDDLVKYQGLHSDKEHTVHGVDKACDGSTDTWDWRGKGWLAVASSHWEVLGWGDNGVDKDVWVVTYFAKTLFTPAGIDVYSRRRSGLGQETLQEIKAALAEIEGSKFQGVVQDLFEVTID